MSAKNKQHEQFAKPKSKKSYQERVYNYEEYMQNADGHILVDDIDNPKESI